MLAIIKTGGKQYRATPGDLIEIEKLEAEVGGEVKFPALLVENGEEVKIGKPILEGIEVIGEIVSHKKGKKVIAFDYKRRKGYERKVGHRQSLSVVKIKEIKGQ